MTHLRIVLCITYRAPATAKTTDIAMVVHRMKMATFFINTRVSQKDSFSKIFSNGSIMAYQSKIFGSRFKSSPESARFWREFKSVAYNLSRFSVSHQITVGGLEIKNEAPPYSASGTTRVRSGSVSEVQTAEKRMRIRVAARERGTIYSLCTVTVYKTWCPKERPKLNFRR